LTLANLRRRFPRLIRQVEKSAHSKFKKKPRLAFIEDYYPCAKCTIRTQGNSSPKKVVEVTKTKVFIPKRLAKENGVLAEAVTLHELREALASQNGQNKTKCHRIAVKLDKTYAKKLGLSRSLRLLVRRHYRWENR